MSSTHITTGFLLVLILSAFLLVSANTQTVTLRPSKWILPSTLPGTDKNIQLDCLVPKYDPYTTILFTIGSFGQVLYNSTSKVAAPGVTVKNQTSILFSFITLGLDNLACQMNQTRSAAITVPYVSSLSLSNLPSPSHLNQTFYPKCTLNIAPEPFKYSISFLKDGKAVGMWTIDGAKSIWSTPEKTAGLNVIRGGPFSSPFTFSAEMIATSVQANGRYDCVFTYTTPNGLSNYNAGSVNLKFTTAPASKVYLTVLPAKFQIGKNHSANCEVLIPPAAFNKRYRVLFYFNTDIIGYYEKLAVNKPLTWTTLGSNNITYVAGTIGPNYYATLYSTSKKSEGSYRCAINYIDPHTGKDAALMSNVWLAKSSAVSVQASTLLAVFISCIAVMFWL